MVRSAIKRPRLLVLSMLSVVLFVLVGRNNVVLKLSARLDLLGKDNVHSLLCPRPQFSRLSLPATGLASFPGSGNTWVRYLIQEATGILTGSEYNDTQLFEDAFPAEGNTSTSTILVKTHGSDYRTRQRYSRVILLVRHPKDAILSEFNLFLGGGHYSVAPEEAYEQHWRSFSEAHASAWYSFHKDWLSYKKPVLVVRYEDVLSNPETQVKRIAEFLQVPITSRGFDCGMNTSKRFIRNKSRPPLQLYSKRMATYLDKLYNDTLININKNLIPLQ
ncbi:hypothetical protein BsWGS_21304 [Bradybaena similaris]